ncbi:glycosyltransferase family 39 protein [Salmonirosea aquatica]|uniref:Uncharacterized protein n=1 Tax=Salmonirosea aquatica TaxID=2654236 RepID=A0A7C9BK59_9BACT|nr:hypothetical protein [Cytophagaceae bacterium SJW1-29]
MAKHSHHLIDRLSTNSLTIPILIGCGILLRLFHYLDNRSLWEDEVFLASSLIHMNFTQLASQPLEYQQRAPLGFLWLVRASILCFNNKEMALRLVSLLGGVVSMFLSVPVAKYFLKTSRSQVTALAIVAFAPPLVYHAVEVKQYGTEFLSTVLCLYLYARYHAARSLQPMVLWAVGGAIILWFSFSSLFVLAGIGIAVSLTDLRTKNWRLLTQRAIPFGIWFISFGIVYTLFIRRYPEETWLVQFWRNREAFWPLPPHSIHELVWPLRQTYSLLHYPLGLTWFDLNYTYPFSDAARFLARMPLLPALIGAWGALRLLRYEKRIFLLFAMPVLMALVASALEFYPLSERLTVFLAPIFVLVVAKGIESVEFHFSNPFVKNLVMLALLAAPLMNSARQLINPDLFGDYKKSRQREAMQYLQKNYRPGDVVYVYWNNLPSFRYYEEAYDFHFNTIYGSDVRLVSSDFDSYFKNLGVDFQHLPGHNRLWYLYKPYNGMKIGDIEKQPDWYYHKVDAAGKVLKYLSIFGKGEKVYPPENTDSDVNVYLFKLPETTFPD